MALSTYILLLYVTNDLVAPFFNELSTGHFLGPFFLLGPVIRAETDSRWHMFKAQNKVIRIPFLRKVVRILNKKHFKELARAGQ